MPPFCDAHSTSYQHTCRNQGCTHVEMHVDFGLRCCTVLDVLAVLHRPLMCAAVADLRNTRFRHEEKACVKEFTGIDLLPSASPSALCLAVGPEESTSKLRQLKHRR